MECPNCGNLRFNWSTRTNCYVCPMCGHEDHEMLSPPDKAKYDEFCRFMKLYIAENVRPENEKKRAAKDK